MAMTNTNGKITYDYTASVKLADDQTAKIEVAILSAATDGTTNIGTPDGSDFTIQGNGTSDSLGTGNELRGDTYLSSVFYGVSDDVQNFHIQYKIDGKVIVDHTNPVAQQPRPEVNITIQFVKP